MYVLIFTARVHTTKGVYISTKSGPWCFHKNKNKVEFDNDHVETLELPSLTCIYIYVLSTIEMWRMSLLMHDVK